MVSTNDVTSSPVSPAPAAQTSTGAEKSRPRVAVVFGGRSGEHTISCATAAGVLRAIDRERYDVLPIGITRSGKWVRVADDPVALELNDSRPPVEITTGGLGRGELAVKLGGGPLTAILPTGPETLGTVDVVLPLLHGPYGEDGTIQGLLEMLGLPYVGCGVLASAVGMDKQVTKVLLGAAGIETAPHVVVGAHRWHRERDAVLAECEQLSFPLFVKPARAGSSLGITRVDAGGDLHAAIEAARQVDPKVLVESGIVGREVEVAVLAGRGDDAPRVAEPGEIVMDAAHGAGEFYDYETKYLAHEAVQMVCPARTTPQERELLMSTAARAFEALGGEGLMRVDFFLTADGCALVNEVNTMPGFTPFSMYPYMWQVSGLGYTELVSELIELALARSTDVNR
ncbi:D-alanine--D-alanine ligase [Actinomyces bovis]|uniref:D-alanine--D-alanine ligase n=1 Tax=Actinomyces bovis TaxID=1658 RepID=A0ABY1VNG4_9ACTO|nr:D-alanine--D-alanine ligase family protein [Actinomyces bovis]SPT52603.1 D-alanine--D-alanine ligase [Actinomyces bovis]VEG54414.1 D-alanine--D-alanine ligase [Actinomyces israelii]